MSFLSGLRTWLRPWKRKRRRPYVRPRLWIEQLEARDLPSTFSVLLNTSASTISENGSLNLSVSVTDPAGSNDAHNVVISWGDGQNLTLNLPAGLLAFSTVHKYLDNPAAPNVSFPINVSVSDGARQTSAATSVQVSNVAPSSLTLSPSSSSITENSSLTLGGSFADPGTLDSHTVSIVWGDGQSSTLSLAPGVLTFSTSHQYLDNPANQPSGSYPISVTVEDKDGGQASAGTSIQVTNIAPSNLIVHLSASTVSTGSSPTLTGTFSDPGTLDTHGVVISWGDGASSTVNLAAGVLTFSASHQYLSQGTFAISANATDKDGGQTSAGTSIQVNSPGTNVLVTDAGGTYTGSPFSASATATDQGGTLAGTFAFTYYNGSLPSGTGSSLAPTHVGTYTVVASFTSANPNYQNGVSGPLTFVITKATPALTVSDNGTYNGLARTAVATVAGVVAGVDATPAASLEGVTLTFTYYTGITATGTALSGAPVHPGTYTVVASFAGSADYASATASTTFSIARATPTVSVSDAGGTFNGSAFSATATVAGAVAGVDSAPAASLEGVTPALTYYAGSSATGTPLAGAPTHPGTYTVVAAFAGSADYTSASATTTFSIARATPAVSVSDAGGTDQGAAFPATATVAGVVAGVDASPAASLQGVAPTLTYYAGATAGGTALTGAPAHAGTYTVVADFAGSADYASASATLTFGIGRAAPVVSVSDAGGTFHGAAFPATATVAGVVAGVDNTPAASLEGVAPTLTYYAGATASGTALAGAPTHPGTYTVVASFAGSADYASGSASTTFSITGAAPVLGISAAGGTFHGVAVPATVTVAGVVAGVDTSPAASLEGVAPTLTYYAGSTASGTALAGAPAHAGTYTVVASFAGSADYASSSASITFSIARATPTVTLSDAGGTFTGAAFPATAMVAGVVAGADTSPAASLQGVAPTLTYYAGSTAMGTPLAGAPAHPGTYTVLASFAGSADYVGSSATTTFSIARAAPTVNVSDAGGTFTGSAFAALATVAGVVQGVDSSPAASLGGVTPTLAYYTGSTPTGTPLANTPTHPGTYTVVASFAGSTDYTNGSASATFTIARALPTLSVSDAGGTYNGTPFVATVTIAGIVNGVDTTPAASLEAVTPTLSYYAGTSATGTPLAAAPTHAGTYTVVASFAGSSDYSSTTSTIGFTIAAALPIVSVSAAGGVYNGATFAASARVAGVVSGVDSTLAPALEGVTPTLAYYAGTSASGAALPGAPSQAGTYTGVASFPGSSDYKSASATASFTIARATPTVSVTDGGGVFDGSSFPASATVTGVVPGLDSSPAAGLEGVTPTLTYYAGSGTTGPALPGAPSQPGIYSVLASFAGSTDYTSASASTTFQISSKPLPLVTIMDQGGTYNGSAYPASATATDPNGFAVFGSFTFIYYNGSVPNGVGSSTAPIHPGTYTVVAVFTSGDPGYDNAQSSPMTFVITRAGPTVTVTDTSDTYSGSPFTAVATVAGVVPGVDTSAATSLEGVTTTLIYYAGAAASGSPISAPVHPGTYTVVAAFAGSTNYLAANVSSSFTISQAIPNVSVSDGGGTFNGSAFAATAAVSGVVVGVDDSPAAGLEGVPVTLTYYAGAMASGMPLPAAPIQAGTYTVSASYAGSQDYTNGNASVTFTIAGATPSVSVTDAGGTFTGSGFPATATVAGVVPGVDNTPAGALEGVTLTLTYYAGSSAGGTPLPGPPSQAGTYTVVASYAGSTDYLSGSASTTFTIVQATPTVSVSDAGGIVNGSAFPATAKVAGVVAGVDQTPAASLEGVTPSSTYYTGTSASGSPLASAPAQPGTYTVVAFFAGSTDYASASATASFTIQANGLQVPTVTAVDASGVYNGSAFTASATATGQGGIAVAGTFTFTYYSGSTVSGQGSSTAPSHAGTYTVVASFASSNPQYGNAQSAPVTFNIGRATPTVNVSDGGTFNGAAFPATATVAGVVTGVDRTPAASLEGVTPALTYYAGTSVTGTPLAGAPTHPGTYTVVASFGGSSDYLSGTATTTFTIAGATPTVSVSAAGGTFNGAAFPATATVAGVVTGVDRTPAASLEGVTPTLMYYAGTSATGTPLAGAATHAGTYTVAASFAGSTDYLSGTATATFTIARATPIVTVSDASGPFTGAAFAATATVAGVVTGVDRTPAASLEGVTPTLTYYAGSSATGTPLSGAPVHPGTFTVAASFAGSTDYLSGTATTTFIIARATPNVSVSDAAGPFTGAAFAATATVAGVVTGVDRTPAVSLEGVTPTLTYYAGSSATGTPLSGAPVHAGTYTVKASFAGSTDYLSGTAITTFTIARTTPTVSVSAAGGTFNGAAFAATATVAGVVTGVDQTPAASLEGITPTLTYYAGSSATGTALSGAPTHAGTYTVVASFAGSTDYASRSATTTFTIARATPTISVSDAGGPLTGVAFPATAVVAGVVTGVDLAPASSLQGVTPTLAYYAGSTTTGTALSGAPSQIGTYAVLASFAGSTDYASTTASVAFSITQAALTATFSNSGPVVKGNAVTVSFTNASDSSAADTQAGFRYSFALTTSGLASSYAAAGTSSSAQFTFANSGSYTVYGRIFAQDGGLTNYTTIVTVNAASAPMHFDFGTSGSPVASGYTKVTQATQYSASLGYGWLSGSIQSTDTGTGSSLNRAFNSTPDGVFAVNVPNGTYLVTLTIGDAAAAVQGMDVWLPASQKLDAVPSTSAGQFITRNYAVTVTNNQLLVEISDPLAPTNYAVINGLDLSLVTLTPPTATFSNNGPINGGSTATVSFSNQAAGTGTYTYSYDFNNNGTFEIANSTSASAVVPASYLSTAGLHVVHGRITDSAGGFNDYSTTINVTTPPATPPVLTSPASLTATKGVATSFGLGSFTDAGANDSPWSITINWGDSTSPSTFTATAQGALHPTHTYATSGNFTATLTVTNSANASATANIPITVAPPGPPSDDTAPYIVTPFDQIPNFGAHPTVHNVQNGAWSSPSTWSTGVVPTTGDIVSIEPGTTVTYDVVSTAAVNTVIIQNTGSLIFRTDINTELMVVNLLVLQGGTLQVGTQANPVAAGVKAQIVFPNVPINVSATTQLTINNGTPTLTAVPTLPANTVLDPQQYGNGLIALGNATMCGAPMNQTFVTLATEPHAGDTTLTLSQAVTGWHVGDQLILPDTRQLTANNSLPYGTYTPEYEQVTIASISANGTVITLSSPLQFDHLGARNEAGVLEYLPQVEDLTRNVVVHSQNPSGTRGQVMFTYQANVDVRYVQFSGVGRTTLSPADNTTFDANGNVRHIGTNEEDRNPVQFRDLFGPATIPADGYQYTFVGNSVFCPLTPMPYLWGININNSDYGLIQGNVLYNWAGAGLVTETGSESYNMIADNMVVRVTGTGNRMDFGRDGVGFWFGGPNNYVVNNVASDISGTVNIYSYGFNLFFEAQYMNGGTVLTIPAYQGADPTVAGQSASLNINTSPLLEFSGNETYGAIANGLAFWSLGERDGISIPGGQAGVIKDFVVWHQWNYGVFAYYSQNLTIDHFVDLGDPSMIGGAGTGMLFGDYAEMNLVVTHADVEGQVYGITAGVAANGTSQTYENSYLNNIYDVWVQPLTTSAYRADLIQPVTIILNNDKFDTPVTTLPTATIEMHMFPLSQLPGLVVNLTQLQQIFVYNYNQVAGDDFQVYYAWQLPNYVMPQSIINSDGTPQVLGAPAANVTNAHAWAVYGIAMEGAVAPANSQTRQGIDGLVDPIPPA